MKLYRKLESIIKQFYKIDKNTKNTELKRTFRSAYYNTYKNKKYILTDNQKIIYILKNNEPISREIYLNGDFNFNVLKKGLSFIKHKKKNLINVGAHVGTTLIPAIKNNIFDNCLAFEPSIENFRLLSANININKIESKVKLFNIGLSNKSGNSFLQKFNNDSGDSRIVKKNNNSEKIILDKLDNFTFNSKRTDTLILIDAQGHEAEIFMGGFNTLKKKIPIIFELQPSIMKNKNFKILFNLLKNYKKFVNLSNNKIYKMNLDNFFKVFSSYLKENQHTDILIF